MNDEQKTINTLRNQLNHLRNEHKKICELVRDQTEADLFLLTHKIQQKILNREEVEKKDHELLVRLQGQQSLANQQLSALRQQAAFSNQGFQQGLLGSLGSGL